MSLAIGSGLQGIVGWRALQSSEGRQIATVARDPVVQRSVTYFRENVAKVRSAGELVSDYRLLNVALSAYGLEGDRANRAFIRQVLESDLSDDGSLANRLSDKRYLRLAKALSFGSDTPANSEALANLISDAFLQREYERRVGQGDENLRLALNAKRELQGFAGRDSSDKTLWYEILGNPPLRKVFEGAFGFGKAYGRLPIDRQLNEFIKASERVMGTSAFKDLVTDERINKLMIRFLAHGQLTSQQTGQSRYDAALTLLSSRLRS